MEIIICLLAMYGLVFLIKESDGPWNLMSRFRNALMRNKYVGVFFYKLLSCWFCAGCHAGYIVYLLYTPFHNWAIGNFIIWSLSGGTFCIIITSILSKLNFEN